MGCGCRDVSPPATGNRNLRAAGLPPVAVRVLAAARFEATGHMGLVPLPGGFGIPETDHRRLFVVDGELSDGTRTEVLTTLGEAGAFAGVDLHTVAHPALEMAAEPDAALGVDKASAEVLADWFGFVQEMLEALVATADASDTPSSIQLWPEHFDLAMELGETGYRANFGGSPGDDFESAPYLYIGPHERREGTFWNAPFGAVLTYSELLDGNDPMAFFQHGKAMLEPE